MESGVYLLYNCLYHGLRWCGQLSLVQRTVALQLSWAGEPGVAELADVRPEGCVGLEVLLEDCLVWQLDSADVTGDGLVCRTGAAGLSDLREVEDLTLCRPVLWAVVLHKAVDLKTLHVSEDLRALGTLQTVTRLRVGVC